MYVIRVEEKVIQLMSGSTINIRGTSKSQKDKSIFRVSKIPYKTQDTEPNKTQ